MWILVSSSIYSDNLVSPGHCVLGSQVLCGASIRADGEGSSSLRPGSTRLSLTHALGRSQATIPGYNGLIMAHTLWQTEDNPINSNAHWLHQNTQLDSGSRHKSSQSNFILQNTKYLCSHKKPCFEKSIQCHSYIHTHLDFFHYKYS